LTLCNAGHPRPLWYRAATRQWSILAGPDGDGGDALANLPLGIDDAMSFAQVQIVLGRGDLILFYTDALTEAMDGDGQQLGETGLLALVRSLDVTDPAKVASVLVQCLNEYRGGKPPDDDLTLLLLHHNAGSPPRLTLGQTLDVYAKVLGLKQV
jgi:sigma-B regulation protein RsbU (phosphoserine phosphatase)